MFLNCEFSRDMWYSVRDWIEELSMEDYERIIVVDLEHALAINSIILITKQIIYNH